MATYYWVGGTGTWDNTTTTNWASTSGGAGGAGVPNNTDTAIFDANSGTAATVTVTSTAVSAATTLNKADLTLSLSGNAILTTTVFTFTTGAIALNNFSLSIGVLSSTNTNTRSIAFGASGQLLITNSGTSILLMDNATNFSYTGTSYVGLTYSGAVGTRTIRLGYTAGTTATNALNVYVSAGSDIINLAITCNTLDFTGFSGSVTNAGATTFYGNFTISSGMTWNAAATALSFIATSGTQQITTNGVTLNCPITQNGVGGTVQLQDNLTMGSTRTYTLTNGTLDLSSGNRTLSTGLFASNNSNVRSVAFGTGNITTTGSGTVWTTATATNFSRTGTPTVNISNNSATATTVSTGTMTEAQSLNFNYTTGTYTLTDTAAVYRSVNFTGFAGTIPNSVRTIFGSLTLSTGMTLTAGANATTFSSTSSGNTITSAGKTQDYPITFNGVGGVWACQDALTQGSTRAFTITNGTVQLNSGVTSTVGIFATSGTNQKFLQSTTPGSQATLSQASGTVNVSNLTIRDINATGGAVWFAPVGQLNIDDGNNDGWDFFVQLGQFMYTRRKNKRLLIS